MLRFSEYRKLLEADAVVPTAIPANTEIDNLIDRFVSELIRELTSKASSIPRTGIWDRMKNFVANRWHGDAKTNPYFWKNKLGNLGTPLENYNLLHSSTLVLEQDLANPELEKLQLVKIIRNWGTRVKAALKQVVANPNNQSFAGTGSGTSQTDTGNLGTSLGTKADTGPTPAEIGSSQSDTGVGSKYKMPGNRLGEVPENWANMSTEELIQHAPYQGLPWNELNPTEKIAVTNFWDTIGGGSDSGFRKSNKMRAIQLQTVPWIFRLGDPRVPVLSSIFKGQKHSELAADGRLEQQDNLIPPGGILKRIQQIKSKIKRNANKAAIAGEIPPAGTAAQENPTAVNTETAPKPKKKSLKDFTNAKMNPEDIQGKVPEPENSTGETLPIEEKYSRLRDEVTSSLENMIANRADKNSIKIIKRDLKKAEELASGQDFETAIDVLNMHALLAKGEGGDEFEIPESTTINNLKTYFLEKLKST